MLKKLIIFAFVVMAGISVLSAQESQKKIDEEIHVIELVQTKGEFVQKELALSKGKYRFKIVNKNVGHPVGFHISERLNDGSNGKGVLGFGKIETGESKITDVIELKEGDYNYDCPLNPTPSYKLTVIKNDAP